MGILDHTLYSKVGRLFLLTIFFISSLNSQAGIEETLSRKYPKCQFVEKSKFLTDKEFKNIQGMFPTRKVSRFYSFYKRVCNDKSSYDFVFSDIVRTKRQLVHIHIEDKKLRDLDIVRFEEPSEYRVRKSWLQKFIGKRPEGIDIVSGATLSSKSTKFLVWLSLYLEKDLIE